MKKLLKLVISIVIIAGIAYGIIYFVNRNKPDNYIYQTLSAQQTIKLEKLYEGESSKVDKCINLLKQERYKDSTNDKINPLINNAYSYCVDINESSYKIYDYLKNQCSLAQKSTSSLQNKVVDSLNNLKKAKAATLNSLDTLEKYLDSEKSEQEATTTLIISYLYSHFKDYVVEYKNYTVAVSQFISNLSTYVNSDVYLNKTNSLKQITISSASLFNLKSVESFEYDWDGTKTDLMKTADKISAKCQQVIESQETYSLEALTVSYHYNECSDINSYLLLPVNEDVKLNEKVKFLANLDTDADRHLIAHYNAVSEYLYGEVITQEQIDEYKNAMQVEE